MIKMTPLKLFLYVALMMLIAATVFYCLGQKHGYITGYGTHFCESRGKVFVATIGKTIVCKNKPEGVVWEYMKLPSYLQ